MKSFLLIAVATLCFGASEPIISLNSLRAVEGSIDGTFRLDMNDAYDLMGPARGTYLPGYGVVFTVYLNLVPISPLAVSPFRTAPGEKERQDLFDRKLRKVPALKEIMRRQMTHGCDSLHALPPDERIVMEAFLFYYNWEQQRGLPHRVVLTARKQQLLDALSRHATDAELAKLFEEEEM